MTLWRTSFGLHGEVVMSPLVRCSFRCDTGSYSWSWRDWWERYWTDHPQRRPEEPS